MTWDPKFILKEARWGKQRNLSLSHIKCPRAASVNSLAEAQQPLGMPTPVPCKLLSTHVAPDAWPPSLPARLPVSKGGRNEAVTVEFSLCPGVLTSAIQAREFLASGFNCRWVGVLAIVEGGEDERNLRLGFPVLTWMYP